MFLVDHNIKECKLYEGGAKLQYNLKANYNHIISEDQCIQ